MTILLRLQSTFYTALIISLIIFLSLSVSTSKCDETNENKELTKNHTNISPTSIEEANILAVDIAEEYEDNNIIEDNEVSINYDVNKKQMTWKHHPDDHGEYSNRSLISSLSKQTASSSNKLDHIDPNSPLNTVDYVEKEWQLMFRALDFDFSSVSESFIIDIITKTGLLENILKELPVECRASLEHIYYSAKKHRIWALRMLDSMGKLPSGVIYGRFVSLGDYEECLNTNVDELVYSSQDETKPPVHHKFQGKYCYLDFRPPMPPKPQDVMLGIHNPVIDLAKTEIGKRFPSLVKYSGYLSALYAAGYNHPFCFPSTCTINNITYAFNQALKGIYLNVRNEVDCEERIEKPLRWPQVISISILSFLAINSTLATILYYLLPDSIRKVNVNNKVDEKLTEVELNRLSVPKKSLLKVAIAARIYLECCSIQTNFYKLTKPDPRGLTFVHYIRVVAMGLTIITHTAAMGTLQALTKPADMRNSDKIFRDLLPQMLANAFNSIQFFFFMAGFMLVLSVYPSMVKHKGKLPFIDYLLKRGIRLWPGLIAAILVNFVWPLFVDGPTTSFFYKLVVEPCENKWWNTLAFISNFDHVEKMCLRHSYFAASDYQLHVMAYPLLLCLYLQPTVAIILATLLTVCGFVAQLIMVITKPMMPFIMVDYLDIDALYNVIHYFHHPVWNHMSAFFLGFIVGYMVVKQIRINISATTISRVWMTLVPMGLVALFAPYIWNHYRRELLTWHKVIYVITDRFLVLALCAWISYAALVLARKPRKKENEEQTKTDKSSAKLPSHHIPLPPPIMRTPSHIGSVFGDKSESGMTPVTSFASLKRHKSSSNLSQQFEMGDLNADTFKSQVSKPEGTFYLGVSDSSPMPRQHSTPNLQKFPVDMNINEFNAVVKPSISVIDVSSSAGTLCQESPMTSKPENNKLKLNSLTCEPKSTASEKPSSSRQSQAICNINTLCLVLSRLTFQLYLFNMVVLWIDVSHSKYYWYFSYYFIYTKSAAIYLITTIFATLFYLILESPALSLYLLWSKTRSSPAAPASTEV